MEKRAFSRLLTSARRCLTTLIMILPEPLANAASPIPLHAVAALAALGLGAVQFVLPKGTRRHKLLGWLWVLLMVAVSLSALFISTIGTWGYFSPIHLLVPFTLFSLLGAVRAARLKDVRRHKWIMSMLFVGALVITGAFTLLPGRVMNAVVFGG